MTDRRIYTPSELNSEAKLHLEAAFSQIWLEAEVSNLSRPASGHLYFSLKDDRAQVRCALFRSAAVRLAVQPDNGMKVLASGRISLYEARGDYQMIVDSLQHAGEGLLQQQFEQLKRKLQEEGLFDPARKRAVPAYPRRIALITSPSGAVIRDMLHVLERRWPIARVRVYPVPVQGNEAPPAIVRALRAAGAHGWGDVILMGRGGGSLEDLWAFNDEGVARAVAACPIPVVSAVGHETDFSIADFVADLRAPTPSAAAELSTPDARALREQFARYLRQMIVRMEDRRNTAGQRLDHVGHRLQQAHPRRKLEDQRRRLALADSALRREIKLRLSRTAMTLAHLERQLSVLHPRRLIGAAQERLARIARTLNAFSPLQTVGRGYALLTVTGTQDVVSRRKQVSAGDHITARVTDGRLFCRVEDSDDEVLEGLTGLAEVEADARQ